MLSEEEKKAIEYYSNKEVSFSVDFDKEKLLKALGITEEDSFENHQIRIKTLLNLIAKLEKKNEILKRAFDKQTADDLKAKGFIEGYKQTKNNASIIKSIDKDFFFELVDFLLEEREQDKARIKELEEENLHWRGSYHLLSRKIDLIPRQKVKDVLDDIYDYFERLNVPDEDIEYIESKRKELLEEGE